MVFFDSKAGISICKTVKKNCSELQKEVIVFEENRRIGILSMEHKCIFLFIFLPLYNIMGQIICKIWPHEWNVGSFLSASYRDALLAPGFVLSCCLVVLLCKFSQKGHLWVFWTVVHVLFKCVYNSSARTIQVRVLFKCAYYSSACTIQVRILFKCDCLFN